MIKPPFPGDFDSLARQYWDTWSEMLGRNGGFDGWGLPGGSAGGMHNPFAGTPFAGNPFAASLASLGGMGGGLPPALAGFDPGAYEWYQQMQRLAADFSNGGAHAAEIAAAWREMMGKDGGHSFARMLRSMHGGLAGGSWMDQVRPMLEAMLGSLREQSAEWLRRPAFGLMRERQERLQALALAWQEWERSNDAFNQLLARVGQDAFARFEVMLQECDEPGKRLESARALFDLWIDAAEEAWAELAFTEEYRHAYGELTNAMMRLRLGLQREVEEFGALLGMPGRTEIDALARKVAELERAQHAARSAAKAATAKVAAAPAPAARRPAAAALAARTAVAAAPVVAGMEPVAAPVARPAKVAKTGKAGKEKRPAVARRAQADKAAAKPATARKPAPTRSTAVRKPPARPAAAQAATANKAPARRAPAPRTAARAKPQAATAAARKSKVARPARAPAAPATEKVVSMKDWVSRNLPGIEPPVAPVRRGKSGRK
ncbi:poly(R)-hydroxyalkanoic acid synthase subunit PhaE [Pseudoxanthomonas koreensis]|uniref:poly(R)-hydroxyalkanoic acid synthase subunit PhaE n=1 Tax=Pseudoxanthomonas koreensis TaxID=266061 RepID=UPI0013908FB5|nr:poly(R)-hydroxyalkanoic acid synthase subunit PhaE [Pseudoxanthomonas koreensis]KAF1693700.1 hypothetical protein CSC64_05060 [Pseudoxanthomonas koreensis]